MCNANLDVFSRLNTVSYNPALLIFSLKNKNVVAEMNTVIN